MQLNNPMLRVNHRDCLGIDPTPDGKIRVATKISQYLLYPEKRQQDKISHNETLQRTIIQSNP